MRVSPGFPRVGTLSVGGETLTLIQWLRSKCPQSTPTSARKAVRNLFAWRYRNDLNRLAQLFCTDKWGRTGKRNITIATSGR